MGVRRVTLDVEREVSSEDLHGLLDRVLQLHGCTGCGLVGIDVRFRVPDPEEAKFEASKFEGIGGFENVSVTSVE